MSSPRILLVDDQVQLSRMLRTSLEVSGRQYTVIDVPSGEEALLELSRGPVDLVVTDLRLPGISGLELLEKLRKLNPNARSIVITGHPSDEAHAKAKALGVIAFLHKPIGTSLFLEAVERALELSEEAIPRVEVAEEEMPSIADMLSALRSELGAEAVLLSDDEGHIVVRAGDVTELDINAALPSLMTAFSSGLKVSGLLGSLLPANFQYFDGDAHDIYLTNVGAFYGLLIAFRGKEGPGRMGSVVHFGRRTADSLLGALSQMGVMDESGRALPKIEPESGEPEEQGVEFRRDELEAAAKRAGKSEADQFWEEATSGRKSSREAEGGALTYDQARKLGLLDESDES